MRDSLAAGQEKNVATHKGIGGNIQSINTVQHAMSSLDGVRDSKKFNEVIDKLFMPTVQAYR